MRPPLRRRVDHAILRWQARLDEPWADRVIPWAVAGVLLAVLVAAASARARSLQLPPDFAAELQSLWLVREGEGLSSSLLGGADVLAVDLSLVTVLLGFVSAWIPATALLLTVQSAALAVTVVPLWRLARRVATLRVGAAAALLLAYACNPVVHSLNLSGFDAEVLALPALVVGVWAGLEGRVAALAASVGVCLAAGATMGLAVLGLGIVLVLNGRRDAGLGAAAAGGGWFVLATFVVQPWLDDTHPHLHALHEWGTTPVGVLTGMLGDPASVASRLIDQSSTGLVVVLLGPLLFLPLLVPRFAVGALPSGAAALLAAGPDDLTGSASVVPLVAFAFVAATFALHRLGRVGLERVTVDRRVLVVLSLASVLFFLDEGATSPYRHPWDWGADDVVTEARRAATDRLPPEVAVRAEDGSLVALAERHALHRFDAARGPDVVAAVAGVDALVVAEADLAGWDPLERARFDAGVRAMGFSVTLERGGIVLYERPADPPRTGGAGTGGGGDGGDERPPIRLPDDPDAGWELRGPAGGDHGDGGPHP